MRATNKEIHKLNQANDLIDDWNHYVKTGDLTGYRNEKSLLNKLKRVSSKYFKNKTRFK